MLFEDRRDAGRMLARRLGGVPGLEDAVVLGLPRGGVPVADEVARALHLPLDIFIVRKLGVPGQPELAMGAIGSGGAMVMNRMVVARLGISHAAIEAVAERERLEIERREQLYRHGYPPLRVEDKSLILVDDGLATGATMLAAARALRPHARRVIAAVPVAAESTCAELRGEIDELICVAAPEPFLAVGRFYRNFAQMTDDEVRAILARSRGERNAERVA